MSPFLPFTRTLYWMPGSRYFSSACVSSFLVIIGPWIYNIAKYCDLKQDNTLQLLRRKKTKHIVEIVGSHTWGIFILDTVYFIVIKYDLMLYWMTMEYVISRMKMPHKWDCAISLFLSSYLHCLNLTLEIWLILVWLDNNNCTPSFLRSLCEIGGDCFGPRYFSEWE